jgi:hypothetical protein
MAFVGKQLPYFYYEIKMGKVLILTGLEGSEIIYKAIS